MASRRAAKKNTKDAELDFADLCALSADRQALRDVLINRLPLPAFKILKNKCTQLIQ